MARSSTWLSCFALAVASIGATGCGTPSFGATSEPLGIVQQSAIIQGRDGAQSGLAFGRSVWTFGDTILNSPDAEGVNWHQNSWSFTTDLDARRRRQRPHRAHRFRRSAHLLHRPHRRRGRLQRGALRQPLRRGALRCALGRVAGRAALGRDEEPCARLLRPRPRRARGTSTSTASAGRSRSGTTSTPCPSGPSCRPARRTRRSSSARATRPGATVALIEDDQLYAFACDTDTGGFSPPCSLARVPAAQALDRQAWTLLRRSGVVLVRVRPRDDLLRRVYPHPREERVPRRSTPPSTPRPFSNNVVIRTAPAITGPWSDPQALFTADNPGGKLYDASSTPSSRSRAARSSTATFTRSNGQGWFGAEFALVRVTLP